MASSPNIINGTLLGIYVDVTGTDTLVSNQTNATMSINMDVRDISSKDSVGWKESAEGQRSFSFSADAFLDFGAGYSVDDLYAFMNTRTQLTVRMSTETSTHKYYEGCAYLTSIEMSAGVEDSATYSITLEGTGALTEGTVA